jgi:hypothetical protein
MNNPVVLDYPLGIGLLKFMFPDTESALAYVAGAIGAEKIHQLDTVIKAVGDGVVKVIVNSMTYRVAVAAENSGICGLVLKNTAYDTL